MGFTAIPSSLQDEYVISSYQPRCGWLISGCPCRTSGGVEIRATLKGTAISHTPPSAILRTASKAVQSSIGRKQTMIVHLRDVVKAVAFRKVKKLHRKPDPYANIIPSCISRTQRVASAVCPDYWRSDLGFAAIPSSLQDEPVLPSNQPLCGWLISGCPCRTSGGVEIRATLRGIAISHTPPSAILGTASNGGGWLCCGGARRR